MGETGLARRSPLPRCLRRWGRNWEVATECPWLGGRIGTAYAQGFQTGKGEDGGKFLLGVITLKRWAGYTVENDRSGYNSVIAPFDLQDSYLPAFRAAVREGKAAGKCPPATPAASLQIVCCRMQTCT